MPAISLCTASSPWHSLTDLVPLAKAAGYDALEPGLKDRTFDPSQAPNFWGNNAAILDWNQAKDEAAELKAALDAADMTCACVGAYVSTDDIDRCAQAIEVAMILGCEFVRVRAPNYGPGDNYRSLLAEARATYRDLDQISAETGVDSLIEIHDHSICPSASATMRVLEGLDPSHVGAILDAGNLVSEGYEPLPMVVDVLGPFLRHVHVKNKAIVPTDDFQNGIKWRAEMGPLADGHLDWVALATLITANGYQGYWSLENFSGVELGSDRLAGDAAWLKDVLAQAGVD